VRSYCYTLVKCLKPFVRNGKGVIKTDDHTQGSPINSEPLVMKGHTVMRRERRRLLLVFRSAKCLLISFPALLSISLFPFPV
jgi:hypothetical protein